MKDKLIKHILKHYKGMNQFSKEYQDISDKMLIEDAEMLIKKYGSVELLDLLYEFKEELNEHMGSNV